MLKLIEGSYASLFPRGMDAMFRNGPRSSASGSAGRSWSRRATSGTGSRTSIPCISCRSTRRREHTGARCGLLPTTGPNMLRDVFPQLLEEGEAVESATIWESSRICAVAAPGQPERMKNGLGYVLSELIARIGEVALLAGLTQIVSVFDARILRVLKAVGCEPEIIGRPQRWKRSAPSWVWRIRSWGRAARNSARQGDRLLISASTDSNT
jgi:Autoinducer synthase